MSAVNAENVAALTQRGTDVLERKCRFGRFQDVQLTIQNSTFTTTESISRLAQLSPGFSPLLA